MLDNLSERGKYILVGTVSIVIIGILYALFVSTNGVDLDKPGTYHDKGSGQTVTTNRQEPQSFGADPNTPTYLGTAALLNFGVSQYQIKALEQALYDFAKSKTKSTTEFSIKTDSIVINDDNTEAIFELTYNRKDKYKGVFRFTDISVGQLTITTTKGDIVFVSKKIDGSKLDN